jgi:hypothetical protein
MFVFCFCFPNHPIETADFYPSYVEGELESLLRDAGGVEVVDSYWDTSNWCVIARKIAAIPL